MIKEWAHRTRWIAGLLERSKDRQREAGRPAGLIDGLTPEPPAFIHASKAGRMSCGATR